MKIGQLKDKKLQLDTTGYANFQATDYQCNNKVSECLPRDWQIVCRKRDSAFTSIKTDGWADCCKYNNINGLKANGITCHPKLYSNVVGDNKIRYSDMCRNICLQTNSPKSIEGGLETTLKNDYINNVCTDILQSNLPSKTEIEEFCQSEVAYKDGKPNPEYTKICGCHYPDSYYEALKNAMEQKFPNVKSILGSRECYSENCQDSKIKHNTEYKCPDTNFLSCIQNQEFNASNVNLEDESQLGMDQSQDCQIIVDGGGTPSPGINPEDKQHKYKNKNKNNEKDGDKKDGDKKDGLPGWTIGLIVGGAVLLLIIIIIIIKMGSSRPQRTVYIQ
jgi:hypothetical protein